MGEVVVPGMEKWTRRCGEKGRTETEEVGEEGGGCAGVGGRAAGGGGEYWAEGGGDKRGKQCGRRRQTGAG